MRYPVVMFASVTQNGPFISPKTYRDLYKPFHKAVNDWVHANTEWKSMIHSGP